MPLEANGVVQWFEDNYIHEKVRQQTRFGLTRDPPLFPPSL